MNNFSNKPIRPLNKELPLQVRAELAVMIMKEYSILPKSPDWSLIIRCSLVSHSGNWGRGAYPLSRGYSQFILSLDDKAEFKSGYISIPAISTFVIG